MNLKKLSKDDRIKRREKRHETQLVIARAKERRFDYVVNPPEIPNIAFGSSMERVTLPLEGPGLTSFMRRHQGEVRIYPGPLEYHVSKDICKKLASKQGSNAFASKLPRLPPTDISAFPPIGAYDIDPHKSFKPHARPFGYGAKREGPKKFLTPGSPTYPYHIPCPPPKLSMAFGSRRVIWPEVAVFCTPHNIAKCFTCGEIPYGDYFHNFSSNLDMCRVCMKRDLKILKNCATDVFLRMRMHNELDKFKPARYCGFFHDHNGTTAAIQIISTKELRKKITKENYLYRYL